MRIYFEDCKRSYDVTMRVWDGSNWSSDISGDVLPYGSFTAIGVCTYVHSCFADVYDYLVDWAKHQIEDDKENPDDSIRIFNLNPVKE